MRKIVKYVIFLFILLLSVACTSFAEDYDGYIVKIKENAAVYLQDESFCEASLFSDASDAYFACLLSEKIDNVSEIRYKQLLVKAEDDEALTELLDMNVVEGYEKNYYLELYSSYDVTENPKYSIQKLYYDAINASFAWNSGITGKGVRVAVIDHYCFEHDDIINNLIIGPRFGEKDYEEIKYPERFHHGTSVCGVIGAECNNLACVGLAFNATVVSCCATSTSKGMTSADAISCIYSAVDEYDCDVINMSFGNASKSAYMQSAVNYAVRRGALVVAAAGNDGPGKAGEDNYRYPASCDNVVSVGNAEKNPYKPGFFRTSSSTQKNDKVDLAAPGSVITLAMELGKVKSASGTSFASPIVAAAGALARQIYPELKQQQFEDLLKQTANTDIMPGTSSLCRGAGMIDVEAFLKEVMKLAGYGDVYVSEVCENYKGEKFICVTNLNDDKPPENFRVVLEETDHGGNVNRQVVYLNFDDECYKNISLDKYGFSENVNVSVTTHYIPGDVDGDGNVSNRDASAVLRYIAGYAVSYVEAAIDVNGDGKINNRDASAILRHISGYEVELH